MAPCNHNAVLVTHRDTGLPHVEHSGCLCDPVHRCVICNRLVTRFIEASRTHVVPVVRMELRQEVAA